MAALTHLSPRHHPLAAIPVAAVLAVVAVTVPLIVILGGEARLLVAALAVVAGLTAVALADLRWEGADMIRLFGLAGVILAVPAALLALVPGEGVSVVRVAGDDRVATATAVSAHGFEQSDAVVVVAPDSAADAVAATPLALSATAPLLFAGTGLAEEIERLGATRAYLVGGLAGDDLLGALLADAGIEELVPVAGPDRHATAAAVAAQLRPERIFVVAGWADAVSVAPLLEDAAIVTVEPATVPPATNDVLRRLDPAEVVVVGGEGAVSAAVERQLRAIVPGADVRRLAGADRWATSLAALEQREGRDTRVWVSSGDSWADAVVAASGAAVRGDALVLVPGDPAVDAATVAWLREREGYLEQVTIVGGEAAVPPWR